jgi:hypothetical protein
LDWVQLRRPERFQLCRALLPLQFHEVRVLHDSISTTTTSY